MFALDGSSATMNITWNCYVEVNGVHFFSKNSLDAGIQDSSTSISIVAKFDQQWDEEGNGDESDKHI